MFPKISCIVVVGIVLQFTLHLKTMLLSSKKKSYRVSRMVKQADEKEKAKSCRNLNEESPLLLYSTSNNTTQNTNVNVNVNVNSDDPQSIHHSNNNNNNNNNNNRHRNRRRLIRRKRRVVYNNDNHIKILFQMYGSVWGSVWPYCLFTVLLTYAIDKLRDSPRYDIDLTINDAGQTFIASLLAFFLVTRVNIAYRRYMQQGSNVDICMRSMRELMQMVCVCTLDDHSDGARKWRYLMAHRIISLLYATVALLEVSYTVIAIVIVAVLLHQLNQLYWSYNSIQQFREGGEDVWDNEYLPLKSRDKLKETLLLDQVAFDTNNEKRNSAVCFLAHTSSSQELHSEEREAGENSRAIRTMIFWLKKAIYSQGSYLGKRKMVTPKLCNLLDYASMFMKGYSSLEANFTTPMPFPLVQLTRTILFVWIFVLPFAIVNGIAKEGASMLIMFLVSIYT